MVPGVAPGVTAPQFAAVPGVNVQPADVTGPTALQFGAQQNAFNQQVGQQNALMGGLFGLGSAAILASDPDIKTDKSDISEGEVLKKVKSMPVESWRYKGDQTRRVGPYADDFSERFGGSDKGIDPVTAFGVSFAAIKALADKVDRLEKRS